MHTSLLTSTHAYTHTQGVGGDSSHLRKQGNKLALPGSYLSVCGLIATKPCVQMNTVKNHFAPKTVLFLCSVGDWPKVHTFCSFCKTISYTRVESPLGKVHVVLNRLLA